MRGAGLVVLPVIAAVACSTPTRVPERFEEVGPEASTSSTGGGAGGGAGGTSPGGGGAGGTSPGGGGAGGTGGTASCDHDPGEPNETIETALALEPLDACDDQSKVLYATLGDAADADWYRLESSRSTGCVIDPACGVSANAALHLCAFFECTSGAATVECPSGTTPESAGVLPGCCGSSAFAPAVACGGADGAATMYIRVDQAGRSCEPYLITYHY